MGQMMQVTGEQGVTVDDYMSWQRALFVEMIYLRQDAFDEVDASVSLLHQRLIFDLISRSSQTLFRRTQDEYVIAAKTSDLKLSKDHEFARRHFFPSFCGGLRFVVEKRDNFSPCLFSFG
ncbi:MAG: hypothetical protein AAF088_19045, partial [Pseudomonadota bacterium]